MHLLRREKAWRLLCKLCLNAVLDPGWTNDVERISSWASSSGGLGHSVIRRECPDHVFTSSAILLANGIRSGEKFSQCLVYFGATNKETTQP
jgi:hypothetical protein